MLNEDPSVFFTKTEFMAAINGFAQLAPELKGSIQFSYQWLGDPGPSRFFAFKFSSRIYIFQHAYPPYGRLTKGTPPFESYFQYRGWYAETWLNGNGLSAAQEWVDTKINELDWLASPLHPANRGAAYKIVAEILFPPTIGIQSIQDGDWQRGIPQFAAGTILTVFGYGLMPFKAAASAIIGFSGIESAVINARPQSKLWDYLGPAAQTAFFLPYVATFKLIKGVFRSSVPIEKMVVSNFGKNYSGIWDKDKPYIITQILSDKINRGFLPDISTYEMATIKNTYDKLINLINPSKQPWTTEMMTRYIAELEKSKKVGLLWSAENNAPALMFTFVPSELIKISGVTSGTKILYHQTISVAYATIEKQGLTPGTATIFNMGPTLKKIFPAMVDAEIIQLLDVVQTLDKTKFLNTTPLFRVVKAYDGPPSLTPIEGA